MAAIRPFRHLIVYPALMREIEREWRARVGERTLAQAELRWLIPSPGSGEFVVNVFSRWLRRGSLPRIARIVEGSR